MFGQEPKTKKKIGVGFGRRKVRFRSSHRSTADLHSPPKGAEQDKKKRRGPA